MLDQLPLPTNLNHQKSWDLPIIQFHLDNLLARCVDLTSRSCILRASSRESGAWLNALPISSLGLRMSDDIVRTAIGLRVGAPICLPHPCSSCGHPVDEFGHHGLSCKFSKGRVPHHHMLNSIIHHSLASANIPSRLEPSNLFREDGKRPDGVTMVPWSNGRFLVWDATCVDTLCDSHKPTTAREAGGAAALAESGKAKKYARLDHAYLFQPVAFETCGTVGPESMSFLRNLGKRLRSVTGEPSSFAYLLQRLSVAIQVGNAASPLGSLPASDID